MELKTIQVYGQSVYTAGEELQMAPGDRLKIIVNPTGSVPAVEVFNKVVPAGVVWKVDVYVGVAETPTE